ncbi:sigma-70 family RNA polymerase sigma factor [Solidesulfovibrio magneticus]|uniref:RNA polymerase ECF-type sigma factor n=1 Tax=Solidesulfovibrio magneticus (strain ATCC 700980 / DSM 13731 / RS-1) TaxID=573370 RepID=C4XM95_SOLM1|nr:sigma-70 family RNA polymerase sigma factor [Solidesulfovibrio magneticus]BAH77223.1 RNA polymerase ECF-type sigma factor [Solidesulfovibrio magneticus RS-1]
MQDELEIMWIAHRDELRAFIARRVPCQAAVDDILQDVFCKTLSHLAQGHVTQPRGWLFAVTRTTIADHYRSRRPTVELPSSLASASPDPSVGAPRAMGACLKPMIDALPEKMRAPLVMADYEGMRQREVASRLGISLAAVKSRVLRARLQMRRMIEECCQLELDARGSITDFVVKPGGCSRWSAVGTEN